MPKRTNKFQRLMALLHEDLDDTVKVKESVLLNDRVTGGGREVDIVIDFQKGSYSSLIGIECTSKSRKSTLTWVEQMLAKHRDLPTNKLILISENGFSHDALKKAKFMKLKPLASIRH